RQASGPQLLHDRIEQLGDAGAVFGGNFKHRVDAEAVELERGVAGAFVVDLVDGQKHGPPGFVQFTGDRLVAAHQPLAAVADQNHQVGGVDGALALDDDE